jgi:formyltetrahydrofolate deformylase
VGRAQEAKVTGDERFVLTLVGAEERDNDLVHAVATAASRADAWIYDQRLARDWTTGQLFLRAELDSRRSEDELSRHFAAIAHDHALLRLRIRPLARRPRVLVLCSQHGHCLADLLSRHADGVLGGDMAAVVSNHDRHGGLVRSYDLPFVHIRQWGQDKQQAEKQLLDLVRDEKIDLVVMARFMQVLSGQLCSTMPFRIINVHHSLLPSFVGGRAYHQALERGIDRVGATAHYATAELDEGPIIAQDAVPAPRNAMSSPALALAGRDAELAVLARAVRLHCEDRVFPNGARLIVFD